MDQTYQNEHQEISIEEFFVTNHPDGGFAIYFTLSNGEQKMYSESISLAEAVFSVMEAAYEIGLPDDKLHMDVQSIYKNASKDPSCRIAIEYLNQRNTPNS